MSGCRILWIILVIVPLACSFNCPSDTEEIKLKYQQLEIFEYLEGCGSANTQNQKALLGSNEVLNCGLNGMPVIRITDYEDTSTSYIKKLCMNVHGAHDVEIKFYSLEGYSPSNHIEDLSMETGWTRLCLETGDEFDAFRWAIYVNPKNDGSEVKIKNMKLTVCRFYTYEYFENCLHRD